MGVTVTNLTSGQIFNGAAALLNDTKMQVYTIASQVPYLNIALQELQEIFEQNEVPVTDTITSAPITIPANQASLAYDITQVNPIRLPDDMIEPQKLWERQSGINPFVPMVKVNSLPQEMSGIELNQFQIYVWESQQLKWMPANTPIDILIEYIRNLFQIIPLNSTGAEQLNIINGETYLQFETAALLSYYIGQNETRSAALNEKAIEALDRALGIGSKGRQLIMTRRRPFRQGFKRRTYL